MRSIFLLLFTIITYISFGQISLQTGSATFSLPMFSWEDNKSHLASTISLSYNSGNGLKVNDVASNEGQGWSLAGGGVITRLQVGEPDDQQAYAGSGSRGDDDITKYPAGYLYAPVSARSGCPLALTQYPIYGNMNQVYKQHNTIAEDRELDRFSYSFNGKAGEFVLDPSNAGVAQPLGDTKMIITFLQDPSMVNQGIRTTITSFTIQDVDGTVYKFARHGLTKVLVAGYCNANLAQMQTQPTFKSGGVYHQAGFDGKLVNPWIIGSWYLTEVDDALTSRQIQFNYTLCNINAPAGAEVTYNPDKNYVIISHQTSISVTPEISSIIYPDGHQVNFNYGNYRVDLLGEKSLASVDITYQSRHVSEYVLNTSYFMLNRYGTPTTDYQKSIARLCLRSVKKIGVDLKEDTPPYIFDYYMGTTNSADDVVPPAFFYMKDIWGYYNGSNSVPYSYNGTSNTTPIPLQSDISKLTCDALRGLCFLNYTVPNNGLYLNLKQNYAQNGLLKQIIYPTGGTLTYEYSQNFGTLSPGGTNRMVGGVHVSKTSSTDGGYSNSCTTPIATQYNYVLADNTSSLWGLEMPVNSMTSSNHYMEMDGRYVYSFPFGHCEWRFQYPGILSQDEAVSLTDIQKFMEEAGPILGVVSAVGTVLDVINVCLSATPLAIIALALDVISDVFALISSCSRKTSDTTTTIFYNTDLNGVSPLPTQFKRVEIIENPGTIGKTVQEFTSSDDYPVWFPTNPDLVARQRFAPWAYGLPKLTTTYKADGNKVKQTENVYDWTIAQNLIDGIRCFDKLTPAERIICSQAPAIPASSLVSCKCGVLKSSSERSDYWSDQTQYNLPGSYHTQPIAAVMNVDFYGMYTGRVNLITNYDRVYSTTNPSQDPTETETDYTYNNGYNYNNASSRGNYEVNEIQTKQSNGDINEKDIHYSNDYSGGALTTLVQNNIIAVPVETISSVSKAGVGTKYLNETVTEFTQVANGDIKPLKTLEQRFNKPADYPDIYRGPGNSGNPTYKQTSTFTYDANSNMVGATDEGNRSIANIYGYNDKYVVASVINADPLVDMPAYTSFETPGFGGWVLSGGIADNYALGAAVTGGKIFGLKSTNGSSLHLTAPLNTAKPYTVSFWANNSVSVTGNSSTLTKSAPTINGYTYYEYAIAQGTASVTISGSGFIDELRLYPQSARMSTTTYDPILGKTSECDENNRITYYQYDNVGRLQLIEDENRNIVKMYEYNNVSAAKQNGCPGVYHNHLISDIFVKSDCGPGYQGSEVAYPVPANRYSSSISQWGADIQAEIDLLTNGQAYANANGSCLLIYYNASQSQSFSTQTCVEGYTGSNVPYSVPAGRYSSLNSQADADQQALDEISANGQAYANNHPACVISYSPDWYYKEGAPTYCKSVNGDIHLFQYETDINPFSPTYNQTRWNDAGPQDACPTTVTGTLYTYYNVEESGVFTYSQCTTGDTGSSVRYTVPIGTYSSTISQADANQQAINDVNANGQAFADLNGTCVNAISYNNQTLAYWHFTATNNATGEVINNIYLGSTYTGSFSLPDGNYTIVLDEQAQAIAGPTIQFNVNGAVQNIPVSNSVTATFTNVNITDNAVNPFIIISTNPLYYNVAYSGNFTPNNCGDGMVGATVTYTVPAGKYSATNQTDANFQANVDVAQNGQAFANNNSMGCLVPLTASNNAQASWILTATNTTTNQVFISGFSNSTSPLTALPPGTYTFAITSGGTSVSTPVQFNVNGVIQNLDITTTTYNANITFTNVVVAAGAISPFVTVSPAYFNSSRSQAFTRNNCDAGYTAGTVTYTIPANKYVSIINQADADQQAIDDINANGQNYANTNGTCLLCNSSTCTGNNHKCINGVCQEGYLDVISQTNSNGICTALMGYFFPDGTYQYDHTETSPGACKY